MFTIAILIGIYSYIIFALGLTGLIYRQNILIVTFILLFSALYFYKSTPRVLFRRFLNVISEKDRLFLTFLGLIIIQILVNFVGVLGPELSFDSLWYHLTLPKLYLENHSIYYIPGGLLYYSTMPKLTEMLYLGAFAFGSEIFAKFIHFSFGILTLIALYKLSRKFFISKFALLACVIFYSNLVVGWMSIAAYVDLARTFFEIMALWGIINWWEEGEKKWLIESGVMLGLAISTKLLAIESLIIFSILILFYFLKHKRKLIDLLISLIIFWSICLLIPLPWFVFSFIHTGNPIYPFLSSIYPVTFNLELINPLTLSDPIFPLYIVLIPIGLLLLGKQKLRFKIISFYAILAIFTWQLTPNTGGGRFILSYLPAFSILSAFVIQYAWKLKIKIVIVGLVVFFLLFSIIYRLGANLKYIPVIIGTESKQEFLSENLNFKFGDFYDTDGFFKKNIKSTDKVLLYGFHNLYYVNFPFIDSTFAKKGDRFNYIAVQNSNIPKRFKNWSLIYYNSRTGVKVYSLGGLKWTY
ncbi:MAG: glycosyltransferase family 39 protein [Candidatus Levybacteria bacterium]|nr:glycosyltransferase family 39 protein [Candidatus Levybacteria bacterium]